MESIHSNLKGYNSTPQSKKQQRKVSERNLDRQVKVTCQEGVFFVDIGAYRMR